LTVRIINDEELRTSTLREGASSAKLNFGDRRKKRGDENVEAPTAEEEEPENAGTTLAEIPRGRSGQTYRPGKGEGKKLNN